MKPLKLPRMKARPDATRPYEEIIRAIVVQAAVDYIKAWRMKQTTADIATANQKIAYSGRRKACRNKIRRSIFMRTVKLYSNPAVNLVGIDMYTHTSDDYEEILRSAIEGEIIDLNEFAEDLNDEPFYGKIQEIKMTVERYQKHVYAVAVCTVSDNWNDADDTPMLKWFMNIEYQYGWGAEFNGKTLHTFKRPETFEMTAPNGERFMHT